MSLYNMLHGYEPTVVVVLYALQIGPDKIPRFRDAYLTYDDQRTPVMVVLTRTGGGNRAAYEAENEYLRTLPGYLGDADDEFDATFALFRYAVPPIILPWANSYLNEHGVPLSLREKTHQAIGPDQTTRQREAGERIAQQIREALARIVNK